MRKWVNLVSEKGVELVLFPELNITGYIAAPAARQFAQTIPGPVTDQIIDIARQHQTILSCGMVEREGGHFYCTHLLVGPGGLLGKQRKIHVPAQEQLFWEAGSAIETFDIGKARVGITICRDSFFDEMTRTLYFKGAEILLMPFGYYNVPRSRYLKESIHGMSLIKASWTNGVYAVVCNSAENRPPNEWESNGAAFPGWAGILSPWGRVIAFVEDEGNGESTVIEELDPLELEDRRSHVNFLAKELRPELYQFQ